MRRLWRRVRFVARWVLFYNVELVWLCWRLPWRLPEDAALPPEADERRRRAHGLLGKATAECGRVCAGCGRCCLEEVDRFTPFDQVVRRAPASPAPSGSRRIYSVPWMLWNAVLHAAQRPLPASKRPAPPPCRHLTPEGCGLSRPDRPMICVSWFCPRAALAMSPEAMDAAEAPLREVEALHREALRAARRPRGRAAPEGE